MDGEEEAQEDREEERLEEVSDATGLAAIAREADLWRELAEIRAKKLASPLRTTRHLNSREELVLRRLAELGVNPRSLLALERYERRMMISHDEARSIRLLITRREIDAGDAHVLGALLARIMVALDGPPCEDDEPATRPS